MNNILIREVTQRTVSGDLQIIGLEKIMYRKYEFYVQRFIFLFLLRSNCFSSVSGSQMNPKIPGQRNI